MPSHDWSERYQPVSYSIARSRSGTGAEFVDMVNRCKAAGVGIIVDAVINHMTNFPSPGVGSNGTSYTKYEYPGLYTASDFHPPCALNNYQSAANVQDCELFSLPDLNTSLPSVRQKIADYLIALARLGVAGFRIDAAKHIQQVDLDEILGPGEHHADRRGRSGALRVPRVRRERPGRGARPARLLRRGIQHRRRGGHHRVHLHRRGRQVPRPGRPAHLAAQSGRDAGKPLLRVGVGAHAVGQGGGVPPEPRHPARLRIGLPATATSSGSRTCGCWPSRMGTRRCSRASRSTVPWETRWARRRMPPGTRRTWCARRASRPRRSASGCASTGIRTSGTWSASGKFVAGTNINHWWDNGANAIAFARGDKGFVAINAELSPLSSTVATGLPPGTYCDLITGGVLGLVLRGHYDRGE